MNNENTLYMNFKKPTNDRSIVKDFNVLILGSENVGKSSLIEYISGLDIFPQDQEIPKIQLNLTLRNINNIKEEGKALEKGSDVDKILLCLNNESFYSFEKLNAYIYSEKKKIDKNSILSVRLTSSNTCLSFNYCFNEIPEERTHVLDADCIKSIIIGKYNMLIEDNNCIFIICVTYEEFFKESKKFEEIVSKYDKKGSRTIFVINKCDLGNIKDQKRIIEITSTKKKVVFMMNRSLSARKINCLQYHQEEKIYFNKNNCNFIYGIRNLELMIDRITEDILLNNSKKAIEIPLNKSKRFIQSQVYDTPSIKRPDNFQNKFLNYIKKLKEGIVKIIDSNQKLVILILESNLKAIKFPNDESLVNNELICEIDKVNKKSDHSKELTVNYELNKDNFMSFADVKISDSSEEKKEKVCSKIYEMCQIILDKKIPKLRTAFSNNYEELECDSKKIIKEVFELSNKETMNKIIENIKTIIDQKYSEFVNIIKLECERELKLSYMYNENIHSQLENLIKKLDEDDFFYVKRDIIVLIRSLIHSIISAKLFIITEIFLKNYVFFFLGKLKVCIKEFKDESLNCDNQMNETGLSNRKGLSVNFSKNASVKSNISSTTKYKVYESSHTKNFTIGSSQSRNKTRSKPDTGIDTNSSGRNVKNSNKIELNLKLIPSFEAEDIELPDEIVMIWDTTSFITIYNLITKSFKKENVFDIPYNLFLENNRYINLPQKVFVSGGVNNFMCTNLFFVLERKSNKITRLSQLPLALTRHSLISLNKCIFLVGGKNNKSCYVYSINKNKWEKLNTLNYEREDASLFCFNEMLFCFGGIVNSKENYVDFLIEFTFLDERKAIYWNQIDINVKVNSEYVVDLLRLSGSGIIFSEILKNRIYISGGYNNENTDEVNYVFEFILIDVDRDNVHCELVKRTDLHLCSPNWFQEANFISLQNKYYNFDIDGNVHIFSMDMEKFFLQEYNFLK